MLLSSMFANKKTIGFSLLGLVLATGTSKAQMVPDIAYGRYQRGLYLSAHEEALKRLKTNPDDAAAMTLIGELNNQGLGLRQDATKAASWYKLAATRGDANALSSLAMMTLQGQGLQQNIPQGRQLLEQAASKHHAVASYNLAVILLAEGTPASLERAVSLLNIAAQSEISAAQHALGVLHAQGRGVPQNKSKAAEFFAKATANGDIAAEVEYAIMLFNGDGVAKDEARAARFFQRSARRDNAIAQNRLARLLASGRGITKDLTQAKLWHERAKIQGLKDEWLDEILKSQ
jgi:uncharacterized protein